MPIPGSDIRGSPTCLFGGSFDPIHEGHIRMARRALEQAPIDEVLFVPAWMPPHKEVGSLSPFSDRLAMLRLAVEAEDRLEVSDIEARRGGYSFTVHTLRDLARARGETRPFPFIMGSDTLQELDSWKEPASFAGLTVPLVYLRDGFDPVPPAGLEVRFTILAGEPCRISSTEIRRRASRGEDLTGLVPEAVADYIVRHGLYREPERS